jgi:small subunit ribosomal protein S9
MADDTSRDDEQQPEEAPVEETPAAEEAPVPAEEAPVPAEVADEPAPAAEPVAEVEEVEDEVADEAPRAKPAIPGADREVDLVFENEQRRSEYDEDGDDDESADDTADEDTVEDTPIAAATIDLAAGARYSATGKRKTAVARVILKPGTGAYLINGKVLDEFFPRPTLQRNIRQPLEAVGYEDRMDVVARMHGGGVSSQAGALRHGISKALLEADPNLRTELKKRGFLTRDARVKERKKAGLKKARKRPQFSKR